MSIPEPTVRWRELRRAIAAYAAGFAPPVLLTYGSLIALAGVRRVYMQLVSSRSTCSRASAALPLERPFEFLVTVSPADWQATWFLVEFARMLPYVGVTVAALGAWRALARRRDDAAPLMLAVSC